jgi:hypothetical protein
MTVFATIFVLMLLAVVVPASLHAAPLPGPVDISKCATVSPVTSSTDVAGLQRDADCYGAAYTADKAQVTVLNTAASAAKAAQKYRLDRIAYVKAHPAPPPPPPPPANPADVHAARRLDFISASPAGVPPIASEFDPKSLLIKTWGTGAIPPSMGTDPLGAFRFICGAGQLLYDDPIAYPGHPGRSHLHQFYGNVKANGKSTFKSLRESGDSTCGSDKLDGTGHALNRSAYWIPAMLDGKGNVVQPDYVQIYYKRIPADDPHCDQTNPLAYGICIPIPNGLRFIAGSDLKGGMRQAHTPKQIPYVGSFRFNCLSSKGSGIAGVSGEYFDLASVPQCPVGGQMESVVTDAAMLGWHPSGRRRSRLAHGLHDGREV